MADRSPPRNPSTPRAPAAEWQAAKAKVLDKLNIRAVYEDMGLKFLNRSESGGRLACYAIDQTKEKTPGSAGVTMSGKFRGYYSDYAHGKLNLSLFDFAIQFGRLGLTDYLSALKHFAAIAGVTLPAGEYRSRRPAAPAPAPPRGPEPVDDKLRENIGEQLGKLHAWAVKTGALTRLAAELHVHKDALIAQRVGFAPLRPGVWEYNLYDRDATPITAPATIWPEVQVVGVAKPQCQSADKRGIGDDKRKMALPRRPRGITVPHGWHALAKSTGHIFICEGGSDVAALHSMGLGALGVPSKGTCDDHIALLVGRAMKKGVLPAGTPITVMVDRDATGFASTERLAQRIANALGRPVAGRFAPSVKNYRKELNEFSILHPFQHDENDPRWESWHKRKGVAKDSREWLGWVANADTLDLERRQALGQRFVAELEFAFDVVPEVVDTKATCVAPSVMEEGGGVLTYCTTKDMVAEGTAPIHYAKTPPPIPPKPPAAPAPPLSPLTKLPKFLTCPKPCLVLLRESRRAGFGGLKRMSCNGFNCTACCNRRKSEWGHHLEERFRHMLTPKPSHFWRGPVADMARVVKRVRKKCGEYCSIIVPGGQAVVIATAAFPGAVPIDLAGATREMVYAIVAIEYRPAEKGKRFRPVNASRNWKLPGRGVGSGDYLSLSRRMSNPKASIKVLERMGLMTHDTHRSFSKCQFPSAWTDRDKERAGQWAELADYPAGYVAGTSPVPDPAAAVAALAPPPSAPPKPPTAKAAARAALRVWAAAHPLTVGAATTPPGGPSP